MNANERLVKSLERLGVERISGYPGGRVVELFDLLPESDIDLVRPRGEHETSAMTEMHGRLTNEPGVPAGQRPWTGGLDLIGQMEARLASSPVVTITEASEHGAYPTFAPYQQSRGDCGGFELPKILDAVTKEHWFPWTPTETVRSLQFASKHVVADRPDPMTVILDGDAITKPFPDGSVPAVWDDETQTGTWTTAPATRNITAAAETLDTAERPVIVSGNGVHASDTCNELATVAEAYKVTVVAFYLRKSTPSKTHHLVSGVIGSFGHEDVNRLVSEADASLVVGCHMNPMDTGWRAPDFICPDEQTITHADIDPRSAGWVYPADVGLIDDTSESLRELTAAGGTDNDWAENRTRGAYESFYTPECGSDATPILPQRAVKEIERVIGGDTVVTADPGNNRFQLLNYLQMPAVQTYYGSGGVGGMGWATPAAASVALATDKHVVGVAGDGGLAMTMTGVGTTVEHDAAPTFVVLNDTSLGMVRRMQHVPDDVADVEFHDTGSAQITEAFGATDVRVKTPGELGDALTDAKTHSPPAVIDARISRSQDIAATFQSSFCASVGGLRE